MPAILVISDNAAFRTSVHQFIGRDGVIVFGVANTRDILSQPKARQVSGYDLIVAEVLSGDHDGLSRLVLFRNLHPNTPFIAVTRENHGTGQTYGGAAARALHAWLVPLTTNSLSELTDAATRALKGELPPVSAAQPR